MTNNRIKISVIVLVLTILLALLIRLYHLSQVPNGFFFDEATISYQAYSLVQTGRDTWGNVLPVLSFKDYGEYILPIGVYGQAVSVFLGGLNVLVMRLPHATLGIITVLITYLLAKELFQSKKIALLTAFLLALSPLSLGWTRFVFEGNFGTFFFLLGTLFFVKSLKNQYLFALSIITFGFAALSYHVFLVIVPVFCLLIFFLNRKSIKPPGRIKLISLILIIFFLIWILAAIYSGAGRQRFAQASTLISAQKIDVLNHQLGDCQTQLPTVMCKLFLNKPTLTATAYIENYIGHFSPTYLGFDGTFLRLNILPRSGILLPIEALGFFVGLFFLAKNVNSLPSRVMLPAMLVYPLANSFTGVGEISRIAFASPFLSLISAYGLIHLVRKRPFLSLLVFLLTLYFSISFLISYLVIFPKTNAYYTNFGYDKVFSWVKQHQSEYKRIYFTRSYAGSVPYISALFFLPVDPNYFYNGNVDRHQDSQGYFITSRINNLYFYDNWSKLSLGSQDFIIASPEEISKTDINQGEFTIIDPTGRVLLVGIKSNAISKKTPGI